MDRNVKTNSGYLSEFDQESIPNISPIDGMISFGSPGSRPRGKFSFDLKLGQVGSNSISSPCSSASGTMMTNKRNEAAGAKSESSLSKRARASANGNQVTFCLVDGCNYDMSNCREYHRRHKVCEVHSKTSVVTINGHKQRFCQQCSRFQSLEEFDEGKRSCRKRLDGHNRRRRKPQPDSNSRSSSFLSDFRGSKLLQFSSSDVPPRTTMVSPSCVGGGFNPMDSAVSFDRLTKPSLTFPVTSQSSSNVGYKLEIEFPFLQDGNPNRQTVQRNYSFLSGGDSDCALSLLSSPSQTHSSTTSIGLNHQNVLVQPLPFGSEPVDSVMAGYGSGLFQNSSVSDGSVSQTFPFHWE